MILRPICWILICLLPIAPVFAQFQTNSDEIDIESWIRKIKEWRMAVAKHTPGEPDAAAATVGRSYDVEVVLTAIAAVLRKESTKKLQYTRSTSYDGFAIRRSPVPIISADVLGSFGAAIAPHLELTYNPNQALKRGALLHTDIAMLGLGRGAEDSLIQSYDGLATGAVGGRHWKYARLLLHWSASDPSRDAMILQWYIATTAYMFSQRQWGFVELNLSLALKYYPANPTILFYAGVLHEINAAPKSQNALFPAPTSFYVDSKDEERNLALRFFRQAIKADPIFAEAHLHLGRVLGLIGKHEEALAELHQAAAAVQDSQLQYFASLFLGIELMILNRPDEARREFMRAKALFPDAQSPLLGLSRLAQKSGGIREAYLSVQEIFKLPRRDSAGDDPWWNYDMSHARNATPLLLDMRTAFGGLSR
jgi:tetratricopeptide (TPR) repeat protein